MDLTELERDCDFEFTRTGGPGGQHRNKVETAVRVIHRPTGITIVASDHRSQHRNREAALQRLAERLKDLEREQAAAEKRRRRKPTKPTRAARQKRLDSKQRRSRIKLLRRRVRSEGDE